MKLPDHEAGQIPADKITGYLLSATHRDGRHKAAFFVKQGFSSDSGEVLADALRRHAADGEVVKSEQTPFGTRHVVEGPLSSPGGGSVGLRVVWFVERGGTVPRLVTAYPLPRGQHSG